MNILTGYLSATSGTVLIDNIDVLENPREAKRHIGYLPENPPLYLDMTVTEYLRFVCNLKGVLRADQMRQMAQIMKQVRISDVAAG
jgi:ABC-2 type transport system ATP-binding protein